MIRILLSTKLGERRWTQADLARMTGIRPGTIGELYHELTDRVSLEQLDLICEALECDLTDILAREPNKEPLTKLRIGRTAKQRKNNNAPSCEMQEGVACLYFVFHILIQFQDPRGSVFSLYEKVVYQLFAVILAEENYPADIRIKSIFCFVIAPEMQRMGIATQLVERVCKDAAGEGFDYVEAYVNKEFVETSHDFRGPLAMYLKCGFDNYTEQGDKVTVRKALK